MHKGSKVVKHKHQWGLIDTAVGPVEGFYFTETCAHTLCYTCSEREGERGGEGEIVVSSSSPQAYTYTHKGIRLARSIHMSNIHPSLNSQRGWLTQTKRERQRQGHLGLLNILLTKIWMCYGQAGMKSLNKLLKGSWNFGYLLFHGHWHRRFCREAAALNAWATENQKERFKLKSDILQVVFGFYFYKSKRSLLSFKVSQKRGCLCFAPELSPRQSSRARTHTEAPIRLNARCSLVCLWGFHSFQNFEVTCQGLQL